MTMAVKVRLTIDEPIQVDAEDHDWDTVVELEGICHNSASAWYLFTALFGSGSEPVTHEDGSVSYEYEHQNSPEIDQNSVPRRIQIITSEFSPKEKWIPVDFDHMIECACDDKGCKAKLRINDEAKGYLGMWYGDGTYVSLQLPQEYRICRQAIVIE